MSDTGFSVRKYELRIGPKIASQNPISRARTGTLLWMSSLIIPLCVALMAGFAILTVWALFFLRRETLPSAYYLVMNGLHILLVATLTIGVRPDRSEQIPRVHAVFRWWWCNLHPWFGTTGRIHVEDPDQCAKSAVGHADRQWLERGGGAGIRLLCGGWQVKTKTICV
jgi:hypothetical protein